METFSHAFWENRRSVKTFCVAARGELCSRKVNNLLADDLVKSKLNRKKVFIFYIITGTKADGRVTELVSRLHGKPFQTSFYFFLSQWVLP